MSKAASTVIEASELGTIDRRNIEEWLGDAEGMSEGMSGDDGSEAGAGGNGNETLYQGVQSSNQATAFNIIRQAGSRATTYFEFLVRPDDRFVSSCCAQEDTSIGLMSLLQKVAGMGGEVLCSHSHSPQVTAGIIVFGEVEYSLPIMRNPPFSPAPRILRTNEIFQMRRVVDIWKRKFLGTFMPKAIPTNPPAMPQSSTDVPFTPLLSTPASPTPFLSTPDNSEVMSSTPTISVSRLPHQTSPPPSPASKRQKSSPALSVTMEELRPWEQDKKCD
ncbi:hypothetical protein BCR34DRAFT_584277 [Clohesyomyces aquaticus]|uniref:Uncharacterized protein n=1 Tax=Clohesyomyces aquaticus TaxID=1231657 RepID=A0A1Y2A2C3_9PLEO|nr:hypothetical protein BCR34DRAFT_584277 [Clohesyomyces aquaticus]